MPERSIQRKTPDPFGSGVVPGFGRWLPFRVCRDTVAESALRGLFGVFRGEVRETGGSECFGSISRCQFPVPLHSGLRIGSLLRVTSLTLSRSGGCRFALAFEAFPSWSVTWLRICQGLDPLDLRCSFEDGT